MAKDNTLKAVINLMKELNAANITYKILEQKCKQLQCEDASKEHKLPNLHDICKRKQQPNQISIDQETNIGCDTSNSTSNINNIQQDENIDTSSGTTKIHNIHQDENIQNAETENALPLHEQQLGR